MYTSLRVAGQGRKDAGKRDRRVSKWYSRSIKNHLLAHKEHFRPMSIAFSQGKIQGKERKNVLQAVQEQAKVAACEAIKPILEAVLEAEVSAKLGREKGESRRISSQERPIDWQCGHCGCTDANCFIRDGHYRRQLATGWGNLSDLRVPMLECQKC